MADNFPTLVTTRYVPPGSYIGQIITPSPGAVGGESRIPSYVGRGSRLAVGSNLGIRRAFVYEEQLTFPTVPLFKATLQHNAANEKAVARIYDSNGVEIRADQWSFVYNSSTQKYDQVLVNTEAYDETKTYYMDYQSVDRDVKDPLPVDDIRSVVNMGDSVDNPQYTEYEHFYIETDISVITGDSGNTNADASVETPVADSGNTGTGTITQNSASEFDHDYTRYYTVTCTAIDSTPVAAQGSLLFPVPGLLADGDYFILDDGVNAATTFYFKTTAPYTPPGGVTVDIVGDTLDTQVADAARAAINGVATLDFTADATGLAVMVIDADNTGAQANNAIVTSVASGFTLNPIGMAGGQGKTADFEWTSRAISAGNDNSPDVPIHNAESPPTFSIDDSVPALLTADLEFGVRLEFAVGASNFAVTDSWTFNGLGPSLFEVDERHSNTNQYAETTTIVPASSNGGTGTLAFNSDNDYSGTYNAHYILKCIGVGGTPPNRTADFVWAEYGDRLDINGTFTVEEATPTTATQSLSSGVKVDVGFGTPTAATGTLTALPKADFLSPGGDYFTLDDGVNPAVNFWFDVSGTYIPGSGYDATNVEVDISGATTAEEVATIIRAAITTTQGLGNIDMLPTAATTSLVTVTNDNTGPYNEDITESLASGTLNPTGMSGGTDGQFDVNDYYTWDGLAPMIFTTVKDDRNVELQTSAATTPSAGSGYVEGLFVTDTPEGSFGEFSATADSLPESNSSHENGHFTIRGNIYLAARNLFSGPTSTAQGNQHAASDVHTFTVTNQDYVIWDLVEREEEAIDSSEIITDITGAVTGTPNTPYVILRYLPITVSSVVKTADGSAVSYTLVTDATGANTPYISFAANPGEDITVTYTWRSGEPDPGNIYYLTAQYVRPTELYDTPQLITDLESGRQLLAPSDADNHLYIMNEVAMGDIGAPAAYYTQVKDPDEDGIYQDIDYQDAITAQEAPKRITDTIILSRFSVLSTALNSVTKMADPFKHRFRLLWVGTPMGTEIGDEDTADTLIYLSRRTLQVYGSSPAHGTRILVAPTYAKRDLRLENGTVIEVTVDGSFVAGTVAALVASYDDPAETILRKQLPGWTEVETYGELESADNLRLGENNIPFMTDQGSGVYRIEEDVTCDTFAQDFNLINNMTQKMFVTRYIEAQTDQNLISIIVPSAEAGVGLVKGFVGNSLMTLLGRGLIGRYQTTDGAERPFDPDQDVVVFRDTSDFTLYHFLYAYYLRNEIKRLFGLYAVNTNDFGAGR